jgi:hypothetical protein
MLLPGGLFTPSQSCPVVNNKIVISYNQLISTSAEGIVTCGHSTYPVAAHEQNKAPRQEGTGQRGKSASVSTPLTNPNQL